MYGVQLPYLFVTLQHSAQFFNLDLLSLPGLNMRCFGMRMPFEKLLFLFFFPITLVALGLLAGVLGRVHLQCSGWCDPRRPARLAPRPG